MRLYWTRQVWRIQQGTKETNERRRRIETDATRTDLVTIWITMMEVSAHEKSGTATGVGIEVEEEVGGGVGTGAETRTETGVEMEAETGAETGAGIGAETGAETEAGIGIGKGVETGVEIRVEIGVAIGFVTEAETEDELEMTIDIRKSPRDAVDRDLAHHFLGHGQGQDPDLAPALQRALAVDRDPKAQHDANRKVAGNAPDLQSTLDPDLFLPYVHQTNDNPVGITTALRNARRIQVMSRVRRRRGIFLLLRVLQR